MTLQNTRDDLHKLPANLPVPSDDGAARHLLGLKLPSLILQSTDGNSYNVKEVSAKPTVFFFYPRTGEANIPAPEGWDAIPGARGCTPQGCAYRDRYAEFAEMGIQVFGVSVQTTAYQQEFAKRNHIPFPILSDVALEWVRAARLPTFEFNNMTLTKRLTLFVEGSIIRQVFYPVFPSDRDAETVLAWLREARTPSNP